MKNIVAIDVGNSETTVGVGNNLSWRSYRYTTRKTITSDELFMICLLYTSDAADES